MDKIRKIVDGKTTLIDDVNPILIYHEKIKTGEIAVSKKIKIVVEKLVRDIEDDSKSDYYFDIEVAKRPITFIETFINHFSTGKVGKPFLLELWQLVIVSAVFGFVHKETKVRKYRELILIVGRKNGKSTLSAAILLYLLIADGEASPNIVSVATMKDQAKIIWETARKMVTTGNYLPQYVKTLHNDLKVPFNFGSFKPLASNQDTLDGLDVHGVGVDELHAITKDLYDVVIDGMGSRNQPLAVITTTAGTVRANIYDMKYEEVSKLIESYEDEQHDEYENESRTLPFVFELDNRHEWRYSRNWEKANPALGTIKNKSTLAEKVNKAKNNPSYISNLLTKEFNIPAKQEQAWLGINDINNDSTFDLGDLKPRYAIAGIDLSMTTDLTAASIMFYLPNDENVYFETMYWLPADTIHEREDEDKVPYTAWVERGLLRLSEGQIVNYDDVIDWFIELKDKYDIHIFALGYDPWNSQYFITEISKYVSEHSLIEVRQGAKTLHTPMKNLEALFKEGKVIYNDNPVTKWCISNTHIKMDTNGNISPVKSARGQRQRIDGFISMLNAYTVYLDNKEVYDNLV